MFSNENRNIGHYSLESFSIMQVETKETFSGNSVLTREINLSEHPISVNQGFQILSIIFNPYMLSKHE